MSERKNIDRLFQEKFQNFEVNPADEVWGNIEAKLDEKKRKRVLPFWWKLTGIAALLAIGFFIMNPSFNHDLPQKNPVVLDNPSKKPTKEGNPVQEQPIVDTTVPASQNGIVEEADTDSHNQKPNKSTIDVEKKARVPQTSNASNSVVSAEKSTKPRSLKNKWRSKESKASVKETVAVKSEEQWATNSKKELDATNTPIVDKAPDKDKSANTTLPTDHKTLNLDELKGKNNSTIATVESAEKVKDSVQKNSVAKNELEDLLAQKEVQSPKESKSTKWVITSNIAPVFSGSVSNGSPIDSTLVNNSKSYNTGVGFGLGVSYAVNKKLSIRTGLNKFNLNYNTNDIVYFAGIDETRALKNVNPTAESATIRIQSSATGHSANLVPSESGLLPFEDSFVHKNKGYINQEMGYLEMPVEVTYALVDKRFGIKIIGGFSTLFLQDNNVSVVSDNRTTVLGEADNLNDIHFSTNIGLGLKYEFMKSFEFNIEPTFKYQLNTFSADAGNFRPYLFGVYSGVSYKF